MLQEAELHLVLVIYLPLDKFESFLLSDTAVSGSLGYLSKWILYWEQIVHT